METTNARPPNLFDLLHRVASTCLSSQCNGHVLPSPDHDDHPSPRDHKPEETETPTAPEEEEEEEVPKAPALGAAVEVEALMEEVFEAVGAVKRAYARLQEAHCPWDPVEMRVADEAVVAELRRLARLKERYRRGRRTGAAPLPLAEAVAPYEAALEEARREVRAKEAELESLKEKVRCGDVAMVRKGRDHSHSARNKKKSSTLPPHSSPGTATAQLFEICVSEVKSASKSFVRHLLSLMRASRQDVASVIRAVVDDAQPAIGPHHAKHALSSYLHRKLFQGFEDESFYMEGSLSSLLQPAKHRRDCYSQFRDMRWMDPAELLGVLPSCAFGRWAGKVYLSIVSAEMEGMLFEGTEQRRVVEGGRHPRTGFYGEYYLRVAKAVWMLHLLAFALEPPPSQFEAARGSEYEAGLMESVIRFPGGGVPSGSVVGFAVAPGFKLGNGTVVRARVYPVPKRLSH